MLQAIALRTSGTGGMLHQASAGSGIRAKYGEVWRWRFAERWAEQERNKVRRVLVFGRRSMLR